VRKSVLGGLIAAVLVFGVPAQTQDVVKNPSALAFVCPDHGLDDAHEIAIVRVSDGAVIQTIAAGDPAATPQGEVVVPINVQPVAFGRYTFRARAIAAGVAGDWSEDSNVWERAPGRPTNLIAR
jgi:hypothetical protein